MERVADQNVIILSDLTPQQLDEIREDLRTLADDYAESDVRFFSHTMHFFGSDTPITDSAVLWLQLKYGKITIYRKGDIVWPRKTQNTF